MKEIPDGWTNCLFNDLIEKIIDNRGKTPPIEKIQTDFPLLEVNSISENMVNPNYNKVSKYISEKSYIEWFRAGHPVKGDILMPTVGTLGNAVVMAQNKGSIAQNIIAIRIISEQDSLFWYYNITSPKFRNQIEKVQMNSAQPSLKVPHMRKFNVLAPPILEQQKIAQILYTVDDKIEVIEQQITETQKLKKGLMQRLLNKGIGHKEFKDSPFGMIPKSWLVVELAKLVNPKRPIRYGIVQTGEYFENGIPCIRVVDFNKREFNKQTMIKTSPEISNSYKTTVLEEGDIVFPLRGRIGDVKLVNENALGANLTRGVALISNSKKINPAYLYWQIRSNSVKKLIELEINGTTLKEVPIGGLKKILIPISSAEEQSKISTILNSVEDKLCVLEDKKTHYQELKKGLMQQLLTGKIRVNI